MMIMMMMVLIVNCEEFLLVAHIRCLFSLGGKYRKNKTENTAIISLMLMLMLIITMMIMISKQVKFQSMQLR